MLFDGRGWIAPAAGVVVLLGMPWSADLSAQVHDHAAMEREK
jgi:hypothetical protein